MLLDNENILSDEQAVTVAAATTNYIDTQNTVNRIGNPLELFLKVDEAATAAGAATVTFVIQESADAAFSSPVTVVGTAAIGKADLTVGARIAMPQLPKKTLRYLRGYFTIGTGPLTAGKFTIGFVRDEQTNGYDAIKEQNDLL